MKLYYAADKLTEKRLSSTIRITKETKKFTYFTTEKYNRKYRYNKAEQKVEFQWGNTWEAMDGYIGE